MRLYAITDRRLYAGDWEAELVAQASRWAQGGVEYVQLREKELGPAALERLAARLKAVLGGARLLVNAGDIEQVELASRVAEGVHLPGAGRPIIERVGLVREIWGAWEPVVSVACHSVAEVEEARAAGVSMVLFAPVFEKPLADQPSLPGVGLEALREACAAAAPVPVFALGGVSVENAQECVAAGAAGVAGVRLFAGEHWLGLTRVQSRTS